MKKYGIFYGSSTGHTAADAKKIASCLGVGPEDVYNVHKADPLKVADYETLILGSSTWGGGDMQDDWYDFVAAVAAMDLKGQKCALFGTGDESMADTFCNAVGELHDRLQGTGLEFVGAFNTDGYTFEASSAVGPDGMAIGLLLDDMNRPELTDKRIEEWCKTLD